MPLTEHELRNSATAIDWSLLVEHLLIVRDNDGLPLFYSVNELCALLRDQHPNLTIKRATVRKWAYRNSHLMIVRSYYNKESHKTELLYKPLPGLALKYKRKLTTESQPTAEDYPPVLRRSDL